MLLVMFKLMLEPISDLRCHLPRVDRVLFPELTAFKVFLQVAVSGLKTEAFALYWIRTYWTVVEKYRAISELLFLG